MLLLFAVDLLNGPFLELVRGNWAECALRESREKKGQGTSRGCVVIGRGDLEVDSDEF